jgi:hypothetical protein
MPTLTEWKEVFIWWPIQYRNRWVWFEKVWRRKRYVTSQGDTVKINEYWTLEDKLAGIPAWSELGGEVGKVF